MPAEALDVFDPAFHADPYPMYAGLRAEDPVHRNPPGIWILARHAQASAMLADHATFTSHTGHTVAPDAHARLRSGTLGLPPEQPAGSRTMLFADPPDHTRLRRLVEHAFTPRRIRDLEQRLRRRVQALCAPMLARGGGDVGAELAAVLPVETIAELLGAPPEDHDRLRRWTLDVDTKEPADDLLSALLAGGRRGEDGALDADEVASIARLLLTAGHSTTASLIGNGLASLLAHPEQEGRLRADPALLPSGVEELLRFEPPVQLDRRIATRDVELGGRRIAEGDLVFALIGAANRDPEVFEEPDRLDVGRRPNRHLGFGTGIHFCVGAALARTQARVALGTLRACTSAIPRVGSEPDWLPTRVMRGLARLEGEVATA